MKKLKTYLFAIAIFSSLFLPTDVLAQAELEAEPAYTTVEEFQALPLVYPKFMVDNLWILIAAALVFIMHLGFSTLETGLTRQKNTVNVLFKNVFIICIGILSYALWGFNAMYPGDMGTDWNGYFAMGSAIGFTGDLDNLTASYADYTYWSDFIFQAMFAATAATIVSGAVAERCQLTAYLIYTIGITGELEVIFRQI